MQITKHKTKDSFFQYVQFKEVLLHVYVTFFTLNFGAGGTLLGWGCHQRKSNVYILKDHGHKDR
jgi:hypothetical protein